MDLYDESEHVISSDEYTDDDNDEVLMNEAIRAQDNLYERSNDFNHLNKQSTFKITQKQKELSSLIRKNKISIIYKNKSIKWLNSKKQRERYKELIYQNKSKSSVASEKDVKKDAKETMNVEMGPTLAESAVSIAYSDKEIPQKTNAVFEGKMYVEFDKIVDAKKSAENLEETVCSLKEENLIPEKRARSLTPKMLNESCELKQNEKRSRIKSPEFYKSINDLFPKFDNIATDHINTITKNTLTSVEEKMKSLINEINTLSEILNAKEMEWNRLLHLKAVKEEIYSRLRQKRQNLLIENYSKMESHRNLEDLKELEFYLSAKKPVSPGVSVSTITIQKLIEKRANMNAEDLEREKNNTNRLHSLLVSSNMLHGKEPSESVFSVTNGKRTNSFTTSKNNELFKQFEEEAIVSKKEGEYRDVKNIIADFRQKNSELLQLAGQKINLTNSNLEQHNISIPVHDKKFSSTQYLHISRQSESFPHSNSGDKISISPTGRFKKLSRDDDSVTTVNNPFNIVSDDNYLTNRAKTGGKFEKNIYFPLCQECKTNESRFVCAGCGNQWYCSKKCQVSAWDKHSDLCTE